MLQCKDCQYFSRSADGEIAFACDPFSTIVEPECLAKWQLIKTNQMTAQVAQMASAYQATLNYYQKLAPMQEKMFKFMEREIDEQEDIDSWKYEDPDQPDEPDDEEPWSDSL
ncbi:MAG: hypothetical protein ACLFUJ_07230 [Phycisphaerae bacterium]